MYLARFVLLALGITIPLCSSAQEAATPSAPAPVAESSVDTTALVPLGQAIFGRLVSVLPGTVGDKADNPCPLENEIPKCFDAEFVRRNALQPVAIDAASEARVLTLQVIEGYINLVAAVGSGQVILAEQQTGLLRQALVEAGTFGEVVKIAKGIIKTAAPVPPALTDAGFAVIGDLIKRFSKSKSVEEQSEALLGGAAVVDGMIANLIEETPKIYEIYRLSRNDELITLEEELALARIAETASSESTAEGGSAPGNVTAASESSEDTSPPPRPVADIETDIAAVRGNVRQFHQDLTTYVVLLDHRRTAIKVLVEAATQTVTEGSGDEPQPNSSQVTVERVRRAIDLLKTLQVFLGNKSN